MAAILVIEQDRELRRSIAQALANVGFHVVTVSDSTQGVRAIYETCPDMVLLGEKLPPINGEHLCSYISRISCIPIIAVVSSEHGATAARLLVMGADACLATPVNRRMLLAKVSSVFRRCNINPEYSLPPGIELDTRQHQLSLGDRIIDLIPTEFRLLDYLALNSDRLVPYPELAIGRSRIVWRKR